MEDLGERATYFEYGDFYRFDKDDPIMGGEVKVIKNGKSLVVRFEPERLRPLVLDIGKKMIGINFGGVRERRGTTRIFNDDDFLSDPYGVYSEIIQIVEKKYGEGLPIGLIGILYNKVYGTLNGRKT